MTRATADWLYQYRWWPWLVMALLLPGLLWPISYWFDVRTVQVADVGVGESPVLLVERDVSRPFFANWHVTVRQWDGTGWATWCNASGASNYRPDARFPRKLTLQWWTDGACHPLAEGRYKITTRWEIRTPAALPDKSLTVESNVFEVRP